MIDDRDARHIFRDAPGHMADTADNRAMLIATVARRHILGDDRFGNTWYARNLSMVGRSGYRFILTGSETAGSIPCTLVQSFDGFIESRSATCPKMENRTVTEEQAYRAMLCRW